MAKFGKGLLLSCNDLPVLAFINSITVCQKLTLNVDVKAPYVGLT